MKLKRETYLEQIRPYYESDIIKVITGVRRAGKSILLDTIKEELIEQGVPQDHIIYLNFEDYDYYELRDPQKLYAYIKPLILQDKMTYIFFDEIQHVRDFPDIINSLN